MFGKIHLVQSYLLQTAGDSNAEREAETCAALGSVLQLIPTNLNSGYNWDGENKV